MFGITSEDMVLTSLAANQCFGGTIPNFSGFDALTALYRAIELRAGTPIEQTPSVSYGTASSQDTLRYAFGDDKGILVVGCTSCIEQDITPPEGWEFQIREGQKTFPVNEYMSQYGKTKIFINPTKQRIVAFVKGAPTQNWTQAFASILFKLMPWRFSSVSEEDKQFFRLIFVGNTQKSGEEIKEAFIKYVDEPATGINFSELALSVMLRGYCDRRRNKGILEQAKALEALSHEIEGLMEKLSCLCKESDERKVGLKALKECESQGDDAVVNFFKNHKQLTLQAVANGNLDFYVDETLEFYDEAEFLRICDRSGSYINDLPQRYVLALKEIFSKRIGLFRSTASFTLNDGCMIEMHHGISSIQDALPNPHIYFYACAGGNGYYYAQYAKNGEWDLAIEQAIAATKNVDFGDPSGERMIDWILDNRDIKCIYYNGGAVINKVDKNMQLISFEEFTDIVNGKGSEVENG